MTGLPHRPIALLLDFDGVIVESVRIKVDAFVQVYAGEDPAKLDAVRAHQHAWGGVTRKVKFRHFEREVFGRDADDARLDALSEAFSRVVYEQVLDCPFVAGAEALLREASRASSLHLVSGTPLPELLDIVRGRGLAPYFTSVHGAPEAKRMAFAGILERHGYDPRSVLAIGDATIEYEAARALAIPFLGIVPPGEVSRFPAGVPIARSLEGIARQLGFS